MTVIQNRQDTSVNWTRVNPILMQGEFGIETDTNKFKIGDGVTAWRDLAYPVPTKTSQLINDSGFLNITSMPTRTSQLINDSNFLTSHQDISNKADRATTLAGYGITDAYTKEQIDGKLSAAMRYKGTVATPYDLPVNPEVGDTYNIEDTGANYAWNGTSWDKLSENIDLSDYALKSTVPTDTSDLTNGAGFITGINSTDVTTALGYTPYNSSNPNGYTNNVGTVTSVNSTQPDANGDVSISIPTNYVTTDTVQNNITGAKTFVGQKKINFRQTSTTGASEKLGFTCYNLNNREVGAFEYNPTYTINSVPLFTLCNSTNRAEGISYLGFRIADNTKSSASLRSAYNIVCPLADDAKIPFNLTSSFTDFYLPLGFTDGTTTVTTPNTGLVNINSLLPDVSGLEQTSNKVTSISSSSTDTQYPSAKCVYDLVGDIETLINAL